MILVLYLFSSRQYNSTHLLHLGEIREIIYMQLLNVYKNNLHLFSCGTTEHCKCAEHSSVTSLYVVIEVKIRRIRKHGSKIQRRARISMLMLWLNVLSGMKYEHKYIWSRISTLRSWVNYTSLSTKLMSDNKQALP